MEHYSCGPRNLSRHFRHDLKLDIATAFPSVSATLMYAQPNARDERPLLPAKPKNNFDEQIARRLMVRPVLTTMAKFTHEALTGGRFPNGDGDAVVRLRILLSSTDVHFTLHRTSAPREAKVRWKTVRGCHAKTSENG